MGADLQHSAKTAVKRGAGGIDQVFIDQRCVILGHGLALIARFQLKGEPGSLDKTQRRSRVEFFANVPLEFYLNRPRSRSAGGLDGVCPHLKSGVG